MSITYRELKPEEWPKLQEASPNPIPDPAISRAFVAEQDGKIVGFTFLQAAWHIEPLFVSGEANYLPLIAMAQQCMPEGMPFFSFIPPNDARMEHIASKLKMKDTGWRSFVGYGGE